MYGRWASRGCRVQTVRRCVERWVGVGWGVVCVCTCVDGGLAGGGGGEAGPCVCEHTRGWWAGRGAAGGLRVHVRELGRAEGHRGPPSQLLSERPRHHLCLPITRCAGSGQQTGAEVWLRRGHRSPAPYAGSCASGSPHALPHPHLLEGTAPPLGPWASLGVHSLSPAEPGDKLPVCAPWGYGSFAHARGPARLSPKTAAQAGSAMGLDHAGPSGEGDPGLHP